MGGFLSGGGPSAPGTPDIPVANFSQQGEQVTTGQRKAGLWDDLVAKFHCAFVDGLSAVMSLLISGFDELMSLWMQFMTKAQGIQNPEFWHLTATMISDLLGVEISAGAIEEVAHGRGMVAGMTDVGGSFMNQLIGEFATGNTLTPESGLKAAEAFLGFLLSFSVREANMEFMSSLIPEEYRFGEDFRQYAVDMARNIGLGRLSRRVLQAPIQALITTPLTWYYNQKYRPHLLSEDILMRTYLRGGVSKDEAMRQLALMGYPDSMFEALIPYVTGRPGATELFRLWQWGDVDQQAAQKLVELYGMTEDWAKKQLRISDLTDAASELSQFISTVKKQRLMGVIDAPTFKTLVDNLPLGPTRREWLMHDVGQQLEVPRKLLSLSEVQQAFEYGYIDITDVDDWLRAEGYSDEDRFTLTLLTLHRGNVEKEKEAILKYKYELAKAKAIKKGEPIPPIPAGLIL